MEGPRPSGCRFLGPAPQGVAACIPGTVLGPGDTALSKAVKTPLLVGWGDRVRKVCRLTNHARQC